MQKLNGRTQGILKSVNTKYRENQLAIIFKFLEQISSSLYSFLLFWYQSSKKDVLVNFLVSITGDKFRIKENYRKEVILEVRNELRQHYIQQSSAIYLMRLSYENYDRVRTIMCTDSRGKKIIFIQ